MADLDIHYDPIAVNSGPITVSVTGLDDLNVRGELAVTQPIETASTVVLSIPDPVRTDSTFALSVPEPIRTESSAAIDLQPVVVDQCLRLSLGPLPPTQVCLPTRQRLGMTLFGVEVFGLTFEGETRMLVSDLPRPPHIVQAAPSPPDPHASSAAHERGGSTHHAPAPHGSAGGAGKPFVVRLPG